MIRFAVCDDEPAITSQIENLLMGLESLVGESFTIDVFYSAEAFCRYVETTIPEIYYDIILMDIEMGETNGVEAGRWLREQMKNDTTLLIYVSGHEQYLYDLFDVQAYNFVRKPINPEEFDRKLFAACCKARQSAEVFTFKNSDGTYSIPYRDIIYFENHRRKVFLHSSSVTWTFYARMRDVVESIQSPNFTRPHESYFVNWDYVAYQDKSVLRLQNGTQIPISDGRSKQVRQDRIRYMRSKELGNQTV